MAEQDGQKAKEKVMIILKSQDILERKNSYKDIIRIEEIFWQEQCLSKM